MSPIFQDELISRYADKGALIDSNLLLAYFIGSYDSQAMLNFKRTRSFTVRDLDLMKKLLSLFKKIVTTPNVLTEVSNLAGQLGDAVRTNFLSQMAKKVEVLDEEYCASSQACSHQYFAKCGLTDAAMMEVARKRYLVITDDFRLANIMASLEIDVINFNHIRSSYLLNLLRR
jgi:hypothetical protein